MGTWAVTLVVMTAGACRPEAAPAQSPAVPAAVTEDASASATPEAEPEEPAPLRVHLSFDDAPWMEERGRAVPGATEVIATNEAILTVLRERDVPASVFFNCDRLQDGERTIEQWAAGGHEVGNHTSSHANLARTPIDEWMADVESCHETLTARLPEPPRYFRYPYLNQGDTLQLRDDAKARLASLGYANAHVTVATTEWLLAYTYRQALRRGDESLRDEVVAAYRQHMVEAVEQARVLAQAEVGRDTAQVVLLHVNELAAAHLPDVLDDYEARGWELVSLEEALTDPVFDRTDHYVGRGGLSWLARIHEDPETRPPYWFGNEERRLYGRYGELWQPPAE